MGRVPADDEIEVNREVGLHPQFRTEYAWDVGGEYDVEVVEEVLLDVVKIALAGVLVELCSAPALENY